MADTLHDPSSTVPERILITVRTRWSSGEQFTLTLDGMRGEWAPDDLIDIARRAAEGAGMVAEPLTMLEVALKWPYDVGTAALLAEPER